MKRLISGLLLTTAFSPVSVASICDIDGNGIVNVPDLKSLFEARNQPAITPFDLRDIDRNGIINTNDVRRCVCKLTTTEACETDLNQPPQAIPGTDQTVEQTTFSIINLNGRRSTDSDGDTFNYAWSFEQRPEGSQATLLNADSETPSFVPDRTGEYRIALTVTDGFDSSHTESVTVTITQTPIPEPTPAPDPTPTPVNLVAAADSNTAQSGKAAVSDNVISNDTVDNTAVQVIEITHSGQSFTPGTAFTTEAGASLQLQANGNYTYLPPNQTPDTVVDEVFTYVIAGTNGTTSQATLTIRLMPANKSPLAIADVTTAEAGSSSISGNVTNNDNLGDTPTVVTPISLPTTPNGGAFTLQEDGSYSYTSPATLSNTVEEIFTYTLNDKDGETSITTLTITVTSNKQSPEAKPDIISTEAAAIEVIGNVLSNDSLGSTPTNVTLLMHNNRAQSLGETFDTLHGGRFRLLEDGRYTYVMPNAGAIDGVVKEVFTYTITDTEGRISASTLSVQVSPAITVNHSPLARPDSVQIIANDNDTTRHTGNVLGNDDLGDTPTRVTPVFLSPTQNNGTFQLQAEGTYTYTAPSGITGIIQAVFPYTITDDDSETSSATLTITVSPPNRSPLARADVNSTTAGKQAVPGNVLSNDDLGNQPAQVTPISVSATSFGGAFEMQANGDYVYTPPASLTGVIDEIFTYTLIDQDGETSTATLTIMVSPLNLAPVAVDDSITVKQGSNGTVISVLSNDSDPDGDTLNIISVTQGAHGIVVNNNNTVSYTPNSGFSGVDSFTYTVSDDNSHTTTATVSITITASPEAGKCVAIQSLPDTGTKQVFLNKSSGTETKANINVIESTKTTLIREVSTEFNGLIYFSIIREEFKVDSQYIYGIKISSKNTTSRNNEIVNTTIDASTLSPGIKYWNSSVCEGQKITHSYTRTGTSTVTTHNTDPFVLPYNYNHIETKVIEAVNESKITLAGTFNTYRARETDHISGENDTSFRISWTDILTGIEVASEYHFDNNVHTTDLIQLTRP